MAIDIAAIDAAIDALVTSQQVNYQVGDKRFDNGDKIRQLKELRQMLVETPDLAFDVIQFDSDIGLDGQDNTQDAIL